MMRSRRLGLCLAFVFAPFLFDALLTSCSDDSSSSSASGNDSGPDVTPTNDASSTSDGSKLDAGAEADAEAGPCDPTSTTGGGCTAPNSKCASLFPDGGDIAVPTCVAPRGSVVDDDAGCDRPTNVAGDDTCAAGFYCTSLTATERHCRRVCGPKAGDPAPSPAVPCGAGELCLQGEEMSLCLPTCSIFSPACPNPDDVCAFEPLVGDTTWNTFCAPSDGAGTAGQGDPCNTLADPIVACVAGAQCWPFEGPAGMQHCYMNCDASHACGGGTCCPLSGASNGAGYCAPACLVDPLGHE